MTATSRKTRSNQPANFIATASVVRGDDELHFGGDVAYDIETGPIAADAEDGSLLSPETARVAAIGYLDAAKQRCIICYDPDEPAMLRQFWDVFKTQQSAGLKLIGFNSAGFDLPFIVKRSWHHGLVIPKNITGYGGRWCETFVDLMVLWRCGSYKDYISLDALARFLGVGEKTGSGERFYKLWETDRKAAVDYLVNDVRITAGCAKKMGVLSA